MGSEDLHHKRKQRNIESLKRQKSSRAQYDVVLVVCEGQKTEPYYFQGLRNDLQLHPSNIQILECQFGSDPVSIVKYALEKFNKYEDYDRVYCVFDGEHGNCKEALRIIKEKSSKNVPIYTIISMPCFEYWLLLHFEESTKPYAQKGKKSPGDQLKSLLKRYIKGYNEKDKKVFEKTKQYIDDAICRAKRINKLQMKSGTDNPSTKVHELVEYLISIKK